MNDRIIYYAHLAFSKEIKTHELLWQGIFDIRR